MKTVDLVTNMDAGAWAKEFMRLYKKHKLEPDFETMRGWFANALMCGHDNARWKCEREHGRPILNGNKLVQVLDEGQK